MQTVYFGNTLINDFYLGNKIITDLTMTSSSLEYRNDPDSGSLVFATPGAYFPTLGMTNAWSDVSADIKGTGTNKTVLTSGIVSSSSYVKFSNPYETSTFQTSSVSPSSPIFNSDNADFEFGAGNFLIECYLLFTAGTRPIRTIAQKYGAGFPNVEFIFTVGTVGDGRMRFVYDSTSAEAVMDSANLSWNQNQWYHVAVGRQGASQFTMWRDGVVVATSTTNLTLATTTSPAYLMGGTYNAPYESTYFQDLRVYKGAAKYSYNTNFTPPSSMVYLKQTF